MTVQPLVMMTFVLQDGRSPLYTASFNGHLDVVKTLMEAGANINQANKVHVHVGRHTCVIVHAKHVHVHHTSIVHTVFMTS